MATSPKLNIEINALVNGLQSLQTFQQEVQQTRERLISLNDSVSTNNLQDFSDDLTTVSTEAETAGQALTRMVEQGLSTATGQTADGFRGITEAVRDLDDAFATFTVDQDFGLITDDVNAVHQSIDGTITSTNNLASAIDDLSNNSGHNFTVTIETARTLSEQLGETATQAGNVSEAVGGISENSSGITELQETTSGLNTTLETTTTGLGALTDATTSVGDGIATVNESTQATSEGLTTLVDNVATASSASTGLDSDITNLGETTTQVNAGIVNLADQTFTLSSNATTAGSSVYTLSNQLSTLAPPAQQADDSISSLLSALNTRTDLEIERDITQVNAQLAELSTRLEQGAISQAEFDRANDVGTQRLTSLQNELANLNNTTQESTESTSNLHTGFMAFAENAMPQTTERVTGLVEGFQSLTDSSNDGNASASILGGTLGKLAGVAGIAATAIVGLVGAISLKEAVEYSARLEALSQVMYTVGGNAGYSREQLDGYEKEVTKLGISSSAAKNAIAQMAGAGLELGDVGDKGASQVARLAEAAKNLSIVAGIDASEAMQNLIININQADTEGLRHMGIILDQVKAEEQFAQSLGISAGALTSKQKQQATMNFVLEGASKFAGIYADSLGTVEAQTALLNQSQSSLKGTIGDLLLPAYKELIRETNNFTQSITESINAVDGEKLSSSLTNLATNTAQGIFGILNPIVDFTIQISGSLVSIGDAVGIVFDSIVDMGKAIFGAFSGNITLADQFNFILKLLATSAYAIADGFKVVELVVRGVLGDIQVVVATTLEALSMIVGYVNKDVAQGMADFSKEMKKAGVENQKASQEIVDTFANGESALQQFVNGAKDAQKALADIGNASNFTELNNQLTALVGKQKELSSVDLDNKLKAIKTNMDELKDSGQLTEEQMAKLNIKMGTLSKNIEAEYSDAFKNMGVTSSELRTGVSADFNTLSGAMNTLVLNAKTTSQDFINAFTFNLDKTGNVAELNKLTEATKEYGERSKKAGEDGVEGLLRVSEATAQARGKFEELFDTQLESAKSSEDFKRLATDVQAFGSEMVKAGEITQEELNLKLAQVADTAKEVGQNLKEAGNVNTFQKMGVDIDVVRTGLSSATNDMTDRLDELLVSSETTASGFKEAFSVAFDQVENLDEWTAIKQKLDETGESGKLMGQELVASTDNAKLKFQELLKAQIESANTKEKFDELKESIANAGATGALSGKEMAQAYQQVQEKIDSAKVSVLELAKQQKELSDKQVTLSQAEVDITRAKITESKAEIDYRKALNEYTKSGTEEARLELEARRLELQLAKERVILAQDKFNVEKANYEVLIAQQKQLNAEKALEIDLTNESLQSIAKRAKEEAEAKQLVATETQETYNKQQMVVSATERASLEARNLADNMKATAQNTNQAKNEAEGLANATERATRKVNDLSGITFKSWQIPNLTKELIAMGVEAERAGAKAEEMVNRANAYQWGGLMHGYDLGNYARVNGYLEEERKSIEQINARKEQTAEIEKRNADIAQQNLDAQRAGYDAILQKGQQQIANAEAMAKGGIVVNESYDKLASNTLPKANQAMEEFKQKAGDVANSALDASNSFISGNRSIQEELLQAQGKEEEALKLRFQNRKAELATEYELLKVKLMVAEATARSAGIDTSAISKALADANKSYVDTLSALNELEKINIQKLADKKSQDTKSVSETAKIASTSNSTASSTSVTPSTGSTSGSSSKTPVVINIDGKSTKVEASDTEIDNLIDVLNELKGRKS